MVMESEVLKAQNCALSKISLPMHSTGEHTPIFFEDFEEPGFSGVPASYQDWGRFGCECRPLSNIGRHTTVDLTCH